MNAIAPKSPAVMKNTFVITPNSYAQKMKLKLIPITAAYPRKTIKRVLNDILLNPKFIARIKANGTNMTIQPSIDIPVVSEYKVYFKSVVPNKYANAPEMANAKAM